MDQDKDSMIAQYWEEREGVKTVFADHGFASYKLTKDYVYIIDIYVQQQHRQKSAASELANTITEIAKEHSVNLLIGSVDSSANGATVSTKALLGYGFELSHVDGNMIYFKKEIA